MTQMIEAIEAAKSRGAVQQWEVACIQQFWNSHYIHIRSHHSNEDVLMVPVLETRFHYPEKFVADHEEVIAKLDKLAKIVKSLGQKEGDSVDELMTELKEYEVMMLPHLKTEEDECLPLLRAYFTKPEIGKVTQSILSKSPKVRVVVPYL
jgi:hemerythrin-like domain-containing protein